MNLRLLLFTSLTLLLFVITSFLLKEALALFLMLGIKLPILLADFFAAMSSNLLAWIGFCFVSPFVPPFLVGLVIGAATIAGTHFIQKYSKAIANWIEHASPLKLVFACTLATLGLVAGAVLLSFGAGCVLGFLALLLGLFIFAGGSLLSLMCFAGISLLGLVSGVTAGYMVAKAFHQRFVKQDFETNVENGQGNIRFQMPCQTPKFEVVRSPEVGPKFNQGKSNKLFQPTNQSSPNIVSGQEPMTNNLTKTDQPSIMPEGNSKSPA